MTTLRSLAGVEEEEVEEEVLETFSGVSVGVPEVTIVALKREVFFYGFRKEYS
jgi:hypothetical protein